MNYQEQLREKILNLRKEISDCIDPKRRIRKKTTLFEYLREYETSYKEKMGWRSTL